MKKGSIEALDWLRSFSFKPFLPFLIQEIYNLFVYYRMTKTFSDEQLYWVQKGLNGFKGSSHLITYKITWSLNDAIYQVTQELYNMRIEKQQMLEKLNVDNTEQIKKEVLEKLEENNRLQQLTEEQKTVREAPIPKTGLPYNFIATFPIITQFAQQKEQCQCKFFIFEKAFGQYHGYYTLSHYLDNNGNPIRTWISNANMERCIKLTREYMYKKIFQMDIESITKSSTSKNQTQIDRVKDMMGLNENNEDFKGDIF